MEKTAQCIVFGNYKGGTGKTTSCISIAGWLAKKKKKVLVVDFDPQANATSGLGVDAQTIKNSIYDAVLHHCSEYEGAPFKDVILDTGIKNLHLAPSEFDLSVAEFILYQKDNKVRILDFMLEEVRHLYDYILIDLPSSPGLLSLNGFYAADHLVIALDACIFSLEALENIKTTFSNIKKMRGQTIVDASAVLIRYVNPRMSKKLEPSQSVKKILDARFDSVFVIPESIEIFGAIREGVPISHYAPKSRAGKAYKNMAKSIVAA